MDRLSFSFIHAADLHLDTPFIGLSHLPHMIRDQIRKSTFSALEQLVDLCIDQAVDFALIAGDLYDAQDRSLSAQLAFQQATERLAEHGIQVFVAHGNHDPLDGYRARLTWPSAAHFFSGTEVEAIPVIRNNREIARVYGISYPTRHVVDRLISQFQRDSTAPYAIGVLHTNVGGHQEHDNYAPATIDELIQTRMDYWALGHIHTRQCLRAQDPVIVYPGNTQGRSIKETGEKGCMLVQVDEFGESKSTFHPLDQVRWVELYVVMEDTETEQDLLDRLDDEINELQRKHAYRSLIITTHLQTGVHLTEQLARQSFIHDLLDSFRIEGEPFIWLQQIHVEPVLGKEEDPFLLEMITTLEEYAADPNLQAQFLQEAWAPLLENHRLGSKWLAHLRQTPVNWEKEVEQLIRTRK